jgi:integrase
MAKAIKQGREPQSKIGHQITVAKQFEAARAAADLDPKVVLHCARHEFATTYLEHGDDLATLKKLMGHSSIAVTEKYLHPGLPELQRSSTSGIRGRDCTSLRVLEQVPSKSPQLSC